MPTSTTRTLNPLPLDVLEPKRFEDLVRQLAYDFRPWRMLEATGRTGSDDGYDARGFEIVTELDDAPEPEMQEDDSEPPLAPPTADRLWLIQCKRERAIGPAKWRQHLADIADEEARNLYGIVFAAACDFSKGTRDVLHTWCRDRGICEVHIWGKAEIEDQLFQPKNDHLLFAYFGISLQIRRRTARTAIRSMLTMKRKALRYLGEGEHSSRTILLRDPEDDQYPYLEEGASLENLPWHVAAFSGNELNCIKIDWRTFYAFLDADGKHWDYANIQPNSGAVDLQNWWLRGSDRKQRQILDHQIHEFWSNEIPGEHRAMFRVDAFIKVWLDNRDRRERRQRSPLPTRVCSL